MDSHEDFMSQAIRLAQKGLFSTHPNPRVGCVLVANNQVVAEGWHERAGEAHAEINALKHVAQQQKSALTAPVTAYVTLEPCSHYGKTPPCCHALVEAGIDRVVIGMLDPNPAVNGQGVAYLEQHGITVISGVLAKECHALNPGFIKRMQTGLPFVRVKMAASLDGRTAMANGESQWITDAQAREDVQQFRAHSDAIITGSGTFYTDNPALTVRPEMWKNHHYPHELVRQPLRVILSSQTPNASAQQSQCFTDGHPTCWLTTAPVTDTERGQQHGSAQAPSSAINIIQLSSNEHASNQLLPVLRWLGEQQINEVWVEAGATLAGAFIAQGLADELIMYHAPCLLGHKAKPMFALPLDHMRDKINLSLKEVKQVGTAIRITATLNPKTTAN